MQRVSKLSNPFDAAGYPTKKTLLTIRKWIISVDLADYHEFMDAIREVWRYADCGYFEQDANKYTLHTGGWSGNESIIYAMQGNAIFWMMYWQSSKRGGHYVFQPARETI